MRKLLIALGLLLLVVVGITLRIDWLARVALERAATEALGVETRVAWVHVALLPGHVQVRGLRIANPPGFENTTFLSIDRAELDVDRRSLLTETIVSPSLVLDGVALRVEQRGLGTNYGALLQRLEADGGGSGKRFRIDDVRIRNVKTTLALQSVAGSSPAVETEVPDIDLSGIGTDSPGGVVLQQVTVSVVRGIVTSAVLQSAGTARGLVAEGARRLLERLAR